MAKVIKNQQTEIHFADFYYFTPILYGDEAVQSMTAAMTQVPVPTAILSNVILLFIQI